MRLIGYWMNDLRQNLCLPQEFTGEMPKGVRKRVAKYLRSGVYCRGFHGFSWCRFFCGCVDEVMGSAELTDGEWVWPVGLLHYVEAHAVTLPDEFIQRALQLELPPPLPQLQPDDWSLESQISLDHWIRWCAEHRSGHLRERIRQARSEGDKVAASHIRQWCAWQISKYGLADYACGKPDCDQKAMFGKKFCCEHGILDFEYEELTRGCYPIGAELVA